MQNAQKNIWKMCFQTKSEKNSPYINCWNLTIKIFEAQHKECMNAYVVMLDNISNDFRFADMDESL